MVTGRGARAAGAELVRLLDATGAVYLDTQESRGLVPADHPAIVGAMRAAAMTEADTVLVIGRKLDYQLGYGSPAVFPNARFVRIADTAGELIDNRRGAPELLATPALAIEAIVAAAGNREPATDRGWAQGRGGGTWQRSRTTAPARCGSDGKIHPSRHLRGDPVRRRARLHRRGRRRRPAQLRPRGLEARTYLDAGAFGCLGVGVPFAIAAALACPDRQVICVTGDGAFGINAMEIDTAVRHGAGPCSSSPTTPPGTSSATTRKPITAAAWSALCWRTRTTPPWPAPSAPMASGSRTRPISRQHWSGRSPRRPP